MPYFIVIVGLLVVVNFYMLYVRSKSSRSVKKKATAERIKTVRQHDDLVRKLDHEQEEAAKHIALQNKTLDLYEQVRTQAEIDEQKNKHTETDEQQTE